MRAIDHPAVRRCWFMSGLSVLASALALAARVGARPMQARALSRRDSGLADVDAWLARPGPISVQGRGGALESQRRWCPDCQTPRGLKRRQPRRHGQVLRGSQGRGRRQRAKPGSRGAAKFYDWFNRVRKTMPGAISVLRMSRMLAHIRGAGGAKWVYPGLASSCGSTWSAR
jgi:hypothetical protein